MASLATLLAMNLVQNNTDVYLYRTSWRWISKTGERIGFDQFVKLELGKPLHHITVDKLGKEHSAPYYISVKDIQATDWYVVGMDTVIIPLEQQIQFPFWVQYEKVLNRNILIKLPQWDDVYISIRGESDGCLGKVSIRGNGVNDWNPTVHELMDVTFIETKHCSPISINAEMRESYLAYAMSVITARALPDVRDGFKPVHRRVIYAMHALGNYHDKAYKKSARVVGDVIGKYHPHSDIAVYESIVRMAQDFSLRYPLIDGQGNFGSIDGDNAAAMRYTEVRLDKITSNMLTDLDFDVVEMVDNYDGTEQIPDVLPARFPNLVVNGSQGIAVGMTTNIAPHNLTEVINATVALIQNPLLPDSLLLSMIPAPDFPTGGTIKGLAGAQKAMLTGKGKIVVTSKYHVEQSKGNITQLVFTEIPYGGNKAKIITNIAQMVNEKKLEGVSNVADESDREGMRIVVTCRRDSIPEIVLSNLLNLGPTIGLETYFHVNNMAIVNGMPKQLTMRQMLCHFIGFRAEVITNRTVYQIQKAKEKAHNLEGLTIALANVDSVIELIKTSPNVTSAKQALMERAFDGKAVQELIGDRQVSLAVIPGYGLLADGTYRLTEVQVNEIVSMRLSKLTALESDQIKLDYSTLLGQIVYLYTIINDHTVLNRVMIEELLATIPRKDERKTMIDVNEHQKAQKEDLIPDEESVVTMSRQGWIKVQPLKEYQAQHRGGRGKSATALRDEDYIRIMLATSMHQTIMLFTTHGKVYWLNVYDLPIGTRAARGKPIQNFIQLAPGEEVTAILPVREYSEEEYLFLATRYGVVKRTQLSLFSNQRSAGLIAIALDEGDSLIGCGITDGKSNVMLFTSNAKAIHFDEKTVRPMGRQAHGVRGIKLTDNATVRSLVISPPGGEVLCVCANGYGKRTKASEYTITNRSTQGMIAINASERNGEFVGAVGLDTSHEVMLCSTDGIVIRTASSNIARTGRNTQGVKLIALEPGAKVSAVESIEFIDTGLNAESGA